MPEIRRLRTGDKVTYSGPVHVDKLCDEVDTWFDDRFDYDADKVLDEEHVKQDHKQLRLRWEAEKDVSDYAALHIDLDLTINDARDITIQMDDGDIHCTDCNLTFSIDTWIETDTEGRYEGRPLLYFLRYVAEHMFYDHYIDEYEQTLAEHCEDLKREINRFLNKDIQQ